MFVYCFQSVSLFFFIEREATVPPPPEISTTVGSSTAGMDAIVHFGSVGRLCGLFERSKAT